MHHGAVIFKSGNISYNSKEMKSWKTVKAPSLQLKRSAMTPLEFAVLFFSSSAYASLSDMIPALSPCWDGGMFEPPG